jgi:hypothetical protein
VPAVEPSVDLPVEGPPAARGARDEPGRPADRTDGDAELEHVPPAPPQAEARTRHAADRNDLAVAGGLTPPTTARALEVRQPALIPARRAFAREQREPVERSATSRERPAAEIVNVTIGRIEVRAVPERTAPERRDTGRGDALETYLRAHSRGHR